jgi:hypothetical protein
VDPHRVTCACATGAEERAARRAGLSAVRVGLGAGLALPAGELVSFGLAGALDGLDTGAVIDAVRVVDADGSTLWEGEGLGVQGAIRGTIVAAERVVDGPDERRELHERTGADAVDLESGVLARSGRLRGCLRVVSDTPARPLGLLAAGVTKDGVADPTGLARAFLRAPRSTTRATLDAVRALRVLRRAGEALR